MGKEKEKRRKKRKEKRRDRGNVYKKLYIRIFSVAWLHGRAAFLPSNEASSRSLPGDTHLRLGGSVGL
jgi:hypothetical protein